MINFDEFKRMMMQLHQVQGTFGAHGSQGLGGAGAAGGKQQESHSTDIKVENHHHHVV